MRSPVLRYIGGRTYVFAVSRKERKRVRRHMLYRISL